MVDTAINKFVAAVWSEKVVVITKDYEIKGYVFIPSVGKKNRIISDIFNGKRLFVSIKECEIKDRHNPNAPIEYQSFIQLNIDSVVLIKPGE